MSTQRAQGQLELLEETLDLLILRTLIFGPEQGIARAIQKAPNINLTLDHEFRIAEKTTVNPSTAGLTVVPNSRASIRMIDI